MLVSTERSKCSYHDKRAVFRSGDTKFVLYSLHLPKMASLSAIEKADILK